VGVLDNTLEARVQALEAELAAIRSAPRPRSRSVDTTEAEEPQESAGPPVSDRRGVVKLLAASAVGVVAAAAVNPGRAAATDGQPVIQGEDNDGTTMTFIHATDGTALGCHSENGYGIGCWGPYGNALFVPFDQSPLAYTSDMGALWVDHEGNWWAATADGTDSKWRKFAGPGTAGTLHLLSAPKRVYDSRPGEPPLIDPKSPLSPSIPRTIDPKGNSSGVPANAQGVVITLTVTGTGGGGFAAVWPSGAHPGTSNINFTGANQTIATTTVVGLAAGATFQLLASIATHVIIDVIGYYL
jgi:hypothetical protein